MSACIVIWITPATLQTPPGVHSTPGRVKAGSHSSESIKKKAGFSHSWIRHAEAEGDSLYIHPNGVNVVYKEGKCNGGLIFGLKGTPGLRRVFNLWRKEQKLEAPLLSMSLSLDYTSEGVWTVTTDESLALRAAWRTVMQVKLKRLGGLRFRQREIILCSNIVPVKQALMVPGDYEEKK